MQQEHEKCLNIVFHLNAQIEPALMAMVKLTRLDTRLRKSRAGEQGQWWNRLTNYLGRGSDAKAAR